MALFASLILSAALMPATTLPTYGLTDGETWSFRVKAKADIQPYSYGGMMTIKFAAKSDGKWTMTINHKEEMEMNGEKGPGNQTLAMWEVTPDLKPTGTGQGANVFGEQLMGSLFLPSAPEERAPLFGMNPVFVTKVEEEKDRLKVTSNIKDTSGDHTVERWLDAKSRKLLQVKCVSSSAIGKITYELLPVK